MTKWTLARLDEVCSLVTDGTHHSPTNTSSGAFKYVTAKNIRPWGLDLSDITYVDNTTHAEIYARCPVAKGDILYIKDGVTTGLAAVNHLDEPFSMLSSVALLKPILDVLEPRFLKHALNSPQTFSSMTSEMTGSAIKRLVLRQIRATSINLPPLNEQKRIADKLDAVLVRVDACSERLNRIPAILKRFRQSVLAAATSGKLTEEWRQSHPASRERIVQLRELAVLITKGASPKWQGISYVERGTDGTLFVTSENVREMRIDISEPKYVDSSFDQKQKRSVLRRGDLLTNIVGASIGRSAIFDSDEKANINQAVCLIRLHEHVNRDFILYALSAPAALEFMHDEKVDMARANLSLEDIGSIPVALPSRPEQDEIVRRVESLFAYADRLEARYAAARAQVEKLTPATLAKAFRGELVPQDPNDEPASVLLARLKSEQEAAPKKGPARGRRKQEQKEAA